MPNVQRSEFWKIHLKKLLTLTGLSMKRWAVTESELFWVCAYVVVWNNWPFLIQRFRLEGTLQIRVMSHLQQRCKHFLSFLQTMSCFKSGNCRSSKFFLVDMGNIWILLISLLMSLFNMSTIVVVYFVEYYYSMNFKNYTASLYVFMFLPLCTELKKLYWTNC